MKRYGSWPLSVYRGRVDGGFSPHQFLRAPQGRAHVKICAKGGLRWAHPLLVLVLEVLQRRKHGIGRGLAQPASARRLDRCPEGLEVGKVIRLAEAIDDFADLPAKQPVAHPARCAIAAT